MFDDFESCIVIAIAQVSAELPVGWGEIALYPNLIGEEIAQLFVVHTHLPVISSPAFPSDLGILSRSVFQEYEMQVARDVVTANTEMCKPFQENNLANRRAECGSVRVAL